MSNKELECGDILICKENGLEIAWKIFEIKTVSTKRFISTSEPLNYLEYQIRSGHNTRTVKEKELNRSYSRI